jgi:hypothetical protein
MLPAFAKKFDPSRPQRASRAERERRGGKGKLAVKMRSAEKGYFPMFDEMLLAACGAEAVAALRAEERHVCEAELICSGVDQNPENSFSIYVLRDPLTPDPFNHPHGAVFYVGQTKCAPQRFLDHMNPNAPENQSQRKRKRIKAIQSAGQSPRMTLLNRVPSRHCALQVEQQWIAYFRKMGCDLTNYGRTKRGNRYTHCLEPDAKAEMSALSVLQQTGQQIMLQCLECCHLIWRDPAELVEAGYPLDMTVAQYRTCAGSCEHCGSGAIIAGVEDVDDT